MKISILSAVHKNLNDLREYIESVKNFTTCDYELIIVNNGAGPDIKQYLDSVKSSTVKPIHLASNVGIGMAMNIAVSVAATDHLFKVDTDCVIQDLGWAEKMVDIIRADKTIGTVGTQAGVLKRDAEGKMLLGYIQGCCQYIPRETIEKVRSCFGVHNRDRLLSAIDDELSLEREKYDGYFRDLALFKHYLQTTLGYWDLAYFYGVDDFDYDLAIRYAGMHVALAKVKVLHKDASLNTGNTKKDLAARARNVQMGFSYFRTKWDFIRRVCGDPSDIILAVLSACFGDYK